MINSAVSSQATAGMAVQAGTTGCLFSRWWSRACFLLDPHPLPADNYFLLSGEQNSLQRISLIKETH